MKQTLKIAVRDLVAFALRSGDLVFDFLSAARPTEAIRIHQKIQKSRPQHYQAEVAVSHQIDTELFVLVIGGRIDGVFAQNNPVLIEEIKTTSRRLDVIEQHANPIHWGQVKTYAYLFAKEHCLDEIDTQLTYVQMDTGQTRIFKQHHAFNELALFFKELVGGYLQWAESLVRWQILRDNSIRQLAFPYRAYRRGQREMAVGVYRTIKDEHQLLVQAATGIGKTMAAVFPALKAMVEGIGTKIFYLTARTTGRIAAEKAMDVLRRGDLRLKTLTITAKDKVCFNPDAACNPEECDFARGHFDRLNAGLRDIFQQDAFTRQTIEQVARSHQICPFEFSLELSLSADVIICDYNYAFDPRVYLRRFFLENGGNFTFLIDEAHNLVDRSREMFSAQMFKQPLLDLRRAVRYELPQVYKILGKINSWMIKARRNCEKSGPARHEKEAPASLYPLLRRFLLIAERWLSRNIKAPYRDALLELYFTIHGFLRVAEQFDESYVTCYEKLKKDLKLKLFCVDPSKQLKNALNRCNAAVFFSATMTPMNYFQRILGCDESAAHLRLPSPFPNENFRLFICDLVSTLYRQRESTKDLISQAILSFIYQKRGNYLVFFPSYKYMQMVYDIFKIDCTEIDHLIQTPSMSEIQRSEFLQHFRKDNPKSLVGFAVMGGIFGEGIDLVGNRLSGAVVVGVGLPGISLERELIREYFADTINAGFEFAYQYPGINRVLQAAGRVIRSDTDRGAVLLIDRRYGTYRYRSLLLDQWQTTRIRNHRQLAEDLQKFWKANDG